ncbi:hypothetical protein Csa_011239 [Cucumis sativus]|uniref:Uncharacterized protein n=1 Tax=Cucumis sativus TaxID=3659 RepID=A0A0A0LAA2_CUCSA|nr:hypothetical protein Csa_011239 [Cucumis sativus]
MGKEETENGYCLVHIWPEMEGKWRRERQLHSVGGLYPLPNASEDALIRL